MADPLHPYSTQPWMKVGWLCLCLPRCPAGFCWGALAIAYPVVAHPYLDCALCNGRQTQDILTGTLLLSVDCCLCKFAQEPNHGVPGDWVTGSRMLDVIVLPLFFAVAFPLLRAVLKKHIYQVMEVTRGLTRSSAAVSWQC